MNTQQKAETDELLIWAQRLFLINYFPASVSAVSGILTTNLSLISLQFECPVSARMLTTKLVCNLVKKKVCNYGNGHCSAVYA